MLKLNRGLLATSIIISLAAAPLQNAYAVSDEVAVQLLERLGDLEKELSNLRGENEMLRNELQDVQSTQREGFLEVDERVSGLEKKRKTGLQDSTIAPEASEPAVQAIPIIPEAGIINQTPALESQTDPAIAATAPETKVSTPAAIPTPAITASGEPAVEVNLNTDPLQGVAPVDVADQRRAITPVTAAAEQSDGKDRKDPAGQIDPNSPSSYYYYGTEDKKEPSQTDTRTVNIAPEKPVAAEKSTTTGKQLISDAHKTKAAYNQAYKLLVNDPKAAVPAFRTFMQDHPDHELVANAQYWLGEALYSQKDYSSATKEFIQVLKKYKSSPKAPGAALKLGYSFYELGQWDFARRTLEDTIKFFPDTNAATLAISRLERMDNENR